MTEKKNIVVLRAISQNDRLPADLLATSTRDLGVPSQGDTLVMPIDPSTTKGAKIYERLLNVSSGPKFLESVEHYLRSVYWAAPYDEDGLKLNITAKDGVPENPNHYLAFKVIESYINLGLGLVVKARTPNEGRSDARCAFIYWNEGEELKEAIEHMDDEADAMVQYKTLTSTEKGKLDWLLTMFGEDPVGKDMNDKKTMLKAIINGTAQIDPLSEIYVGSDKVVYKERPGKYFEAIAQDKDLEHKAMIDLLVRKDIIDFTSGLYYFGEQKLGKTLKEVIINMTAETPEGSKLMNQLKAKYEIAKKG